MPCYWKRIAALLLAAGLALPAAVQAQAGEPDRVELPMDLERVLRDYERAWAAGDADGIARLFAPDGLALPNAAPIARGMAQLAQAYAGHGAMPLALRAYAHGRSGDLAYIVGGFAPSQDRPAFGKFLLLLRCSGAQPCLILADMDNANAPMRR